MHAICQTLDSVLQVQKKPYNNVLQVRCLVPVEVGVVGTFVYPADLARERNP